MTLSFPEARQRAVDQLARDYAGPGTFAVAEWGFDDGSHYVLDVGARERIYDGQDGFVVYDDTTYLVDKRSGVITRANTFERFDVAVTPVGNWELNPGGPEGADASD